MKGERMHVSTNRREFFASIGGSAVATMLRYATPTEAFEVAETEYLFSPGLIYLSTGTLGPCSRHVVEQTVRAWYELETNPHATAYGEGKNAGGCRRHP